MCLTINLAKHPTKLPLTAKEDIIVYKLIHDDNKSLYQYFEYTSNTLYRLRKNLIPPEDSGENYYFADYDCINIIYRGFHSYVTVNMRSLQTVHRISSLHGTSSVKIVQFIIPKGAKYFIGSNNDIVSTSIRSGDLTTLKFKLEK